MEGANIVHMIVAAGLTVAAVVLGILLVTWHTAAHLFVPHDDAQAGQVLRVQVAIVVVARGAAPREPPLRIQAVTERGLGVPRKKKLSPNEIPLV